MEGGTDDLQPPPLYERLKGPNQWPRSDPRFRPVIENYIDEMTKLGERFLKLVAEALELPSEEFLPFLSEQHRLKLVHYPPGDQGSGDTQGVGPHKDVSESNSIYKNLPSHYLVRTRRSFSP